MQEIAAGSDRPTEPTEPSADGAADLQRLFERARQALAGRLHLATGTANALVLPPDRDTDPGIAAAELRIDDRTRQVVVRVYDARTGATIRELPAAALTALAARVGRTIA